MLFIGYFSDTFFRRGTLANLNFNICAEHILSDMRKCSERLRLLMNDSN